MKKLLLLSFIFFSFFTNAEAACSVTINPSVFPGICQGSFIILTASPSGTPPYSYSWSNGSTTSTINVSAGGTYSVSIIDSVSCSATSPVLVVTVNPKPVITINANQTICNGSCATLSVGATGSFPLSYLWSPLSGCGTPAASFSCCPTATTTYSVTVVDSKGCVNSASTKITVNPVPTITTSNDTCICSGGAAIITVSGALHYVWMTGTTTSSILVNPTSTVCYSVTASDANGCTATKAPCVCVNALPSMPVISCGGDTIFSSFASSYQWFYNNSPIAGATDSFYVEPIAGTYSLLLTTTQGCNSTFQAPSCFGNSCSAIIDTSGPTTFCQGGSVKLTAIATGIPKYSYSWSNGLTTSSINVTASGTYTVVVTDSVGCAALSQGVVVQANPLPVIIARDTCVCFGSCVVLTASGGSSYSWSTGTTTSTIAVCPIVTTCYTVIASNLNGCTAVKAVCVCVNPLPVTTVNPPVSICAGICTLLSASGGVKYIWIPGTCLSNTNISNPIFCCSATMTYTVVITNASGCTGTQSTTVTVNPLPIVKTCADTTICEGDCAHLCASGGFSYSWSPTPPCFNSFTLQACCSATTTYSVIVTDANGCVNIGTETVTVLPPPCSVGIKQANEVTGIRLFPNPFSNSSVLVVPDEIRNGNITVSVYDVLGNRLNTIPIEKEQTIINRRDLASGIYFYLIMKDEKRIYERKMVVE